MSSLPEEPGRGPYPTTPLAEAWKSWVRSANPQFDIFATLTFRHRLNFDEALKASQWWLRKLSVAVLGHKQGRLTELPSFRVVEPHRSGDPHVHVMAERCRDLDLRWARNKWVRRHGECLLTPFDPSKDALGYCLKGVGINASEPDVARELWRRTSRPRPTSEGPL